MNDKQKIKMLRESIHEALSALEADKKIYDKSNVELIRAYSVLESAFVKTGTSYSTFDESKI